MLWEQMKKLVSLAGGYRLSSSPFGLAPLLVILCTVLFACLSARNQDAFSEATIQPSSLNPDRLAEPALPADPTQYEHGRYLYWMHCMTCHGDRGQGLTEEFRNLWVSDHQNCWAKGCHAGREGDEGFPIPHDVPAIISTAANQFSDVPAEELFAYLRRTHPPQRPGDLSEDEYWAITNYVLTENERLLPGQRVGPRVDLFRATMVGLFVAAGLILLTIIAIIIWFYKRQKV